MTTMGDRWTDDMVDELLHNTHNTTDGQFNYVDFVRTVKHGTAKDTDVDDIPVTTMSATVGGARSQTSRPTPADNDHAVYSV